MENDFLFESPAPCEDAMHLEWMHNMLEQTRALKLTTNFCAPVAFRRLQRINSILLEWNPMQIPSMPFDEYLHYAPRILKLLQKKDASEALTKFLYTLQPSYFGQTATYA